MRGSRPRHGLVGDGKVPRNTGTIQEQYRNNRDAPAGNTSIAPTLSADLTPGTHQPPALATGDSEAQRAALTAQ